MIIALYAALAIAGGHKDKDPAPEAAPVVPAEPTPPPEPDEPPPPPAEPAHAAPNASFDATIAYADGHTKSGHVVRVERGIHFYAENGWEDSAAKLVVELDAAGHETEAKWDGITSVDIKYAGKTAIDCMYESNWTPWMYTCTMGTTSTVHTADGKTYTALSRYQWRFTFADGTTTEFYLGKLPARRQDANTSLDADENYALYADLQAEVQRIAGTSPTKITIKK